VRVWLPALKAVVLKAAVPLMLSGTWARTSVPSRKVTMPVGVPDPGGAEAAVAVNVTV
jgi:hypothetical protein